MSTITEKLTSKLNFRILSGSSLKIIAIILMLIDHIGAVILYHGFLARQLLILPDTTAYNIYIVYQILRFIGRASFPIFCFLLVQGFVHTSNKRGYAVRLFLFALISEIPFDIAIHGSWWTFDSQNVFFTLLIGFFVLWLTEMWKGNALLQIIIAGLGMGLAYLMKTDYSYWGIILIVVLYYFRNRPVIQTISGSIFLAWEAPAILAFIPINMYNGKRGISLKYFFYVFYPAHLLLLTLIRYLVFKV